MTRQWRGGWEDLVQKWWKPSEKLVLLKEVWFPARSACSFGHGGCITGTASPTRFGGQENSTDHWRIGRISQLIAILCMMNKISDRVQMLTFIRSVIFSHGWFRMNASTALQSLKEFDDWPSPIILIAKRNMDVTTTNRPLLKWMGLRIQTKHTLEKVFCTSVPTCDSMMSSGKTSSRHPTRCQGLFRFASGPLVSHWLFPTQLYRVEPWNMLEHGWGLQA